MNDPIIFLNGAPVIGFDIGVGTPPAAAVASALPWGEMIASGVVSTLAGLAVDRKSVV